MIQKRDIAMQGVVTALALVVGMLIGGRYCADGPSGQAAHDGSNTCDGTEPAVVERVVRLPPEIIYECPPEPEPEPPRPGPAATPKKSRPRPTAALPEAETPPDPLARQRLLAWVRDRAADLEPCRDDSKDVYRLTVTMHVDEAGRLTRVDIGTGPGEAPPGLVPCLRARILRWQPPAEFINDHRRIVFGLTF